MDDLLNQNMHMNAAGYDSRIFVDKNAAITYQCGICHNVCNNAVEITEKEDEYDSNDNNLDNVEQTLFCYECILQSNISRSYHPSKFIRNVINNLIVLCPHSIDFIGNNNSEGGLETQCQWQGTLLNLQTHMETECVKKPLIKCPFDCNDTKGAITHNHFNQYQTQHINILLSMVQSLTNQLSKCQNQIIDLHHEMNENKQEYQNEINTLKQQISMSYSCVPPPPPPSKPIAIAHKKRHHNKNKIKNKHKNKNKNKNKNKYSSHNSHLRIRRPIDSIGSDFKFQFDHPNISVIANGRTAIGMESKDILIEFGQHLIKHKPSHKSRNRRRRDSSVDDFFAHPSALKLVKKHSVIVLDEDEIKTEIKKEERISQSMPMHKMRRSFSNPFKRHKERENIMNHRKNKSETMKFEEKNNVFAMSKNNLREYDYNNYKYDFDHDKITCFECFIFIEECDRMNGNIGIAIIKDTNDGIAVLYKNGDYINLNKHKINKGFTFKKGNIIKINMSWKGVKCFVSVLNTDTNVSVIIDKFDMWINLGFILNQSRISVIEQYWM